MNSLHDRLRDFRCQAEKLAQAGSALDAVFAREATHLKRQDEASRLSATYRAVAERFHQLRELELSASRGHSQANLALSLVELAVTALVSKSDRLSAVANCLINGPTARKQPFGLVMAYIGPRGLPEDAGAVSISQQAREANQMELDIMNRLRDDGYLLFSEETFSLLIDRLIIDIREGKLRLPVSREKLSEITELNKPKLRIKIVEVK